MRRASMYCLLLCAVGHSTLRADSFGSDPRKEAVFAARSSDGSCVATSLFGAWAPLTILDGMSGRRLRDVPPVSRRDYYSAVMNARFLPGTHILAAAGSDGELRLIDVDTGMVLSTVACLPNDKRYRVGMLEISRDGRWLALEIGAQVQLYKMPTGERVDVPIERGALSGIGGAFPRDESRFLVVGLGFQSTNVFLHAGAIGTWRATEANFKRFRTTRRSGPTAVAISPDGERVVVGYSPHEKNFDVGGMSLFGANTTDELVRIGGDRVFQSLQYSADGRRLFARAAWDAVVVYEAESLRTIAEHRIEFAFEDGKITVIEPSPDGSHVLIGDNARTVRLWNVDQKREVFRHTLPEPIEPWEGKRR